MKRGLTLQLTSVACCFFNQTLSTVSGLQNRTTLCSSRKSLSAISCSLRHSFKNPQTLPLSTARLSHRVECLARNRAVWIDPLEHGLACLFFAHMAFVLRTPAFG